MTVGCGPAGYPRYGYAGAYGYESGLLTLAGANPNLPPITLQHVGERWYDPGLGRFIQRDPIGLAGGLNVYLYCGANPLTGVDPSGLWRWWFDPESDLSDWVARNFWLRYHSPEWINSPWAPAEAVGIAVLVPVVIDLCVGYAATVATGAGAGALSGLQIASFEVLMQYRTASGAVYYVVRLWLRDGRSVIKHLEKLPW